MDLDPLFTRLNPLLLWILRSPLHGLVSAGLVALTITGRKTGRRYTIPVGYQRDGDALLVAVSRARRKRWWRNFSSPREVEVRLRGRDVRGDAAVVEPRSEEFRRILEQSFRRVRALDRQFGIRYDAKAGLSEEQVRQLREEAAIVRITLRESGKETLP